MPSGIGGADPRQVFRLVPRQRQPDFDADLAPRVIDEGQAQRRPRRQGDPVEAGFPVVGFGARALRRDGQVEAVALREQRRQPPLKRQVL